MMFMIVVGLVSAVCAVIIVIATVKGRTVVVRSDR